MLDFAKSQPDWVVGFQDETWWSRYEQAAVRAWAEQDQPLRLVEQTVPKDDKEPKALACYGLLVSCPSGPRMVQKQVWLRFVDGRPVSAITNQYLAWCCDKLEALGKRALLLIWDNAPWHRSRAVRDWIRAHNQQVMRTGKGVRIVPCYLPSKSPWLNPIEPRWAHAKRCIVEHDGVLSSDALTGRVCSHFQCSQEPRLSITD